ncbi:hypothetical protein [Nostoc sp.]|uniref:hypothetical protein n=1 Tax=Nostoc sp. TaxID=1180 RepID=UPI002FF7255C
MTTVIFVHGTGIREREYNETFQIIEQKIHAQRPDIIVACCLWGELGAKFNDNRLYCTQLQTVISSFIIFISQSLTNQLSR